MHQRISYKWMISWQTCHWFIPNSAHSMWAWKFWGFFSSLSSFCFSLCGLWVSLFWLLYIPVYFLFTENPNVFSFLLTCCYSFSLWLVSHISVWLSKNGLMKPAVCLLWGSYVQGSWFNPPNPVFTNSLSHYLYLCYCSYFLCIHHELENTAS